ncbi:LOW QUALITY PROTEIN: transmembrane protein 202 [Suncus etruscus]|uniref:LOW QUALITY PROTEIN: transmembrane protein 202 n=1 Tax=Suncus etruscus TaxID=109475 RepID=UPI0021100DAC|nr:LOW QUALITY PROTEIN: transmembrane protein 202 [Suncus etruscus]
MADQVKGRAEVTMTFHNPKAPQIKGDQNYNRPTLPTKKHPGASMSPERRQHHVDQTHTYFRMFCGSLCGFSFLMVLMMSPMKWVQLLVIKNGLELYAGLWVTCSHELCWRQTATPPYYLEYSRVFFIFSIIFIVVALGWLVASCLPRRGGTVDNLDLKVSILSFMSAICLLFCLIIFLKQVHWHAENIMEANFLWPYYLNWWCDLFYILAGIISLLNHLTSSSPVDQNVTVKPVEKSRLGVGPVTEVTEEAPVEAEEPVFQNESLLVEDTKEPDAEL